MLKIATILALAALPLPLLAQQDFFELAPIKYSQTPSNDPMAQLAKQWESGAKPLPTGAPLDILKTVLTELGVPSESQVLVFSKTSKQNHLIRPSNPRCIFFAPDIYVGYVPGGSIEVAATDPLLGPVFYLLDLKRIGKEKWVSRDNSCLQCHGTSRTELVPGVLVRSVFPNEDGHPILAAGTYLTNQASPLKERWGGWYVTGCHGDFRHMGNTIAEEKEDGGATLDVEIGANLDNLEGRIDLKRYPQPGSDIVALMVLEHQCALHNLLTKASMEYRRLSHLQRAIDPKADLEDPKGMAARSAADSAEELLRAMLFCDEIDLGDGVEGGDAFVEAFEGAAKKTKDGRSLRQLRLYGRLFKYRCSYLIHSSSFDALPDPVRARTLTRLWEVLHDEEEAFAHLGSSEKKRILEIVGETVERLPECWE